jgi:hypothetical protein
VLLAPQPPGFSFSGSDARSVDAAIFYQIQWWQSSCSRLVESQGAIGVFVKLQGFLRAICRHTEANSSDQYALATSAGTQSSRDENYPVNPYPLRFEAASCGNRDNPASTALRRFS